MAEDEAMVIWLKQGAFESIAVPIFRQVIGIEEAWLCTLESRRGGLKAFGEPSAWTREQRESIFESLYWQWDETAKPETELNHLIEILERDVAVKEWQRASWYYSDGMWCRRVGRWKLSSSRRPSESAFYIVRYIDDLADEPNPIREKWYDASTWRSVPSSSRRMESPNNYWYASASLVTKWMDIDQDGNVRIRVLQEKCRIYERRKNELEDLCRSWYRSWLHVKGTISTLSRGKQKSPLKTIEVIKCKLALWEGLIQRMVLQIRDTPNRRAQICEVLRKESADLERDLSMETRWLRERGRLPGEERIPEIILKMERRRQWKMAEAEAEPRWKVSLEKRIQYMKAALRDQEMTRYSQHRDKMQSSAQILSRAKAEHEDAYIYTDLCSSSTRFRLLKLHAKCNACAFTKGSPIHRPPPWPLEQRTQPREIYPRLGALRARWENLQVEGPTAETSQAWSETLESYFADQQQPYVDELRQFLETKAIFSSNYELHRQYRALCEEEKEFNAWHNEMLVCSLETFDVGAADCPPFEALSYEWNTSSDNSKKELVVNGAEGELGCLEISHNLWTFLKHMQNVQDDEFWVWADAVCINQNSDEERGHQVKLMGEIYTRASRVLAWLPVSDPEHIVGDLESIRNRIAGGTASSLAEYQPGHQAMEIFGLSYWTRKWIIQEVLLARSVVLVLGTTEIPLRDLEDILAAIEEAQRHMSVSRASRLELKASPVAQLIAHRRNKRSGKTYPQTLGELLVIYKENQCGDPLDHVYALYNLIIEHREQLQVRYGQDRREWLVSVLHFIHEHEQSSRANLIRIALELARMVDLHTPDFMIFLSKQPVMPVTVAVFDIGSLRTREECAHSMELRKHASSLHPGLRWIFKESSSYWKLHQKFESVRLIIMSKRVLEYFEIPEQRLHGLASVPLKEGDRVWQFLDTEYALIVRFEKRSDLDTPPTLCILGRCYLFEMRPDIGYGMPVIATLTQDQLREVSTKQHLQSYDLQFDLCDLYPLAYTVTNSEFRKASLSAARLSQSRQSVPVKKPKRERSPGLFGRSFQHFRDQRLPSALSSFDNGRPTDLCSKVT